ncbi:hypothetical protein F4781DRAFT_20922 [Annulohypoxylon bovei var. microspora]|nr:hypothetical protein F4781DRAFT_20922 [Annulohypoxylon bovei var. microspora]
MKPLHGLLAALTLLTSGAWALPQQVVTVTITDEVIPIPSTTDNSPESTTALIVITSSTRSNTIPPITTLPPSIFEPSTSSFTGKCEYSYCYEGTNVCFYWAGVTSWDVSRGPLPGEIPTMLGPCESELATA